MKILFIDNFPFNFGIASLSKILKNNGHTVKLLYYHFSKWTGIDCYQKPEKYFSFERIFKEIQTENPDIIGFSVFSSNYMFYKKLAQVIKSKSSIPIIVGGVYPTLNPKLLMEDTKCDFLFRGEAEPVIADLLPALLNDSFSHFPNLVYRNKNGDVIFNEFSCYVEDIDSVPFYDKELYPFESIALYIITSRGCSMSCSYCSAGQYTRMIVRPNAQLIRKRSIDSVLAEIQEAISKRNYKEVFFYDDFFISSKKWLKEFSQRYRSEINMPYSCIVSPGSLTEENVQLLKNSNCKLVLMGFQTANEHYKRDVLKRNESNESVRNAIINLNNAGIKYSIDHIFNLPGETRADYKRAIDFYADHKVKELSINFLNYYPGSPITNYALANGFMNQEQFDKINNCELIGEQSYKGTILNKAAANKQVQLALLFRLTSLLPKSLITFLFNTKSYLLFPTNRYLYYLINTFFILLNRGLQSVVITLYFSLPIISKLRKKTQF